MESNSRVWTSQSQMIICETALSATNAASSDAGATAVTSRPSGQWDLTFDGRTI